MPGLDPGIHSVTANPRRYGMDGKVKPVKPCHDDKFEAWFLGFAHNAPIGILR